MLTLAVEEEAWDRREASGQRLRRDPHPWQVGSRVGTFTGPQGKRDACEGKAPIFQDSPTAAPSYCLALGRLAKISKDWLALGWLSTTWL